MFLALLLWTAVYKSSWRGSNSKSYNTPKQKWLIWILVLGFEETLYKQVISEFHMIANSGVIAPLPYSHGSSGSGLTHFSPNNEVFLGRFLPFFAHCVVGFC